MQIPNCFLSFIPFQQSSLLWPDLSLDLKIPGGLTGWREGQLWGTLAPAQDQGFESLAPTCWFIIVTPDQCPLLTFPGIRHAHSTLTYMEAKHSNTHNKSKENVLKSCQGLGQLASEQLSPSKILRYT